MNSDTERAINLLDSIIAQAYSLRENLRERDGGMTDGDETVNVLAQIDNEIGSILDYFEEQE